MSTSTLRTEQRVEQIVDFNETIEQFVWQLEERIVAIPRGNQRAPDSLVGDDVQLVLQVQSERQRQC